jgi:uncharacterized protein (TIGR02246 family)
MRYLFLAVSFFLVCNSLFCQSNLIYNPEDSQALNALPGKWQKYWNTHNMDSMARLFANDVDFVTKSGTWFKGKEATVNHHKKNHATIFKTSIWTTDSIAIKYVKPDLAIMHIGWGISGDFSHDGTPGEPRHGISTWVVIKEKGEWLLLAVQNANIVDPH